MKSSLFATPTPYYNVGSFNQLNYTYGCEPGYYEVTLIANNQGFCPDTAMAIIQIYDDVLLYVPNSFTPNGDGFHDTWNIVGLGASAKVFIFDRYGKLVKQIVPSGEGWDGTLNGEPLIATDYWFTVDYSEPKTGESKVFHSHFSLKR